MQGGGEWTDERVEQLRNLWTEGLSASQIARVLGGVSRNAVIGKVHRIGLSGRPPNTSNSAGRVPRAPPNESKPLMIATAECPDGELVRLVHLNDRMCRWPIGDPQDHDFHFCGRKPVEGGPYCEAHRRKAYQPQNSRGYSVNPGWR